MTVLLNTENLTEKWKSYLEVNQKAKPVGFCAPDKKKINGGLLPSSICQLTKSVGRVHINPLPSSRRSVIFLQQGALKLTLSIPHVDLNNHIKWNLRAASSTESSFARIPPILLKAGIWIPYFSSSSLILLISSSETYIKKALQSLKYITN